MARPKGARNKKTILREAEQKRLAADGDGEVLVDCLHVTEKALMEYPARFNQAALDFWDEVERPLPRSFHGFSPTADFWQPKISCLWQPRIRITMLSPTTFLFWLLGGRE